MGKAILTPIDNPEKVVKASNCLMSDEQTSVEDALSYSTTEHVVGKWIDGSTLYEKTIDCGALPDASAKTVNHNISNIKEVVDIKGVFGNGSSWFMINNANPSQLIAQIQVVVDTLRILITTAANLSSFNQTWVTIQYTKTS